jgi:hypothetical protein
MHPSNSSAYSLHTNQINVPEDINANPGNCEKIYDPYLRNMKNHLARIEEF